MQHLNRVDGNILVLGCGNILFGDDGFGVYVAEYLQKEAVLPPNISVVDARTSVRGILFDVMLDDRKPEKIIIIDAVDAGKRPGEVFTIGINELPVNKIDDFSLHQMPTSNLLRELKDLCDVEIVIIVAQVEHIPEAVSPGLSKALKDAVVIAVEEILRVCE
jgi:coenzyme F420 hydrogenase subunit delta